MTKDYTHVTNCYSCGRYWNSFTIAQAMLLWKIHENENSNHDVVVKDINTLDVLKGKRVTI